MPEGRPDPREVALRQAIDEITGASRTTLAELTDAVRRRGLLDHVEPDPDAELDEVLRAIHGDEHWVAPDEVVVLIDPVVRDLVMTHRLTEDDLARSMLDADPDLELLDKGWLDAMFLDGEPFERVFPDEVENAGQDGSFVGPPGWLDQYRAGDVLALRRVGRDVTIERVDEIDEGAAEVAALRQAFDARERPAHVGELIEAVVLDALLSTPGLFRRPVRPIGELLRDAGLSCQGGWTGPADVDWAPDYVAAAESDMSIIHDRYQLDECCDESLYAALDMWNEFVVGTPGGAPREWSWSDAADELAHGEVAAAFTDYVLRDHQSSSNPFLASFAHDMAQSTRKRDRAIAAYLLARNLEREGSAAEAEAALETAVDLYPDLTPALDDLAWYAADRGQVDKAVNLLRRAGAEPDDPHLQILESMRPTRNAVGRNERCPCGSGRKYKDCCQRLTMLPIERRASWLEHKLWTYTLRPRHQSMPIVLSMRMSPDDDDAAYDLLRTGLPMDLAAFEGGLAAQFLQERGSLLPIDERELLETWLQHPRELWEVAERVTDSTVVGRRVATGELVTMTSVSEGDPGDLLLGRVAPLGDSMDAVGTVVLVPARARSSAEALVASQPGEWAIADWFAGNLARRDDGQLEASAS